MCSIYTDFVTQLKYNDEIRIVKYYTYIYLEFSVVLWNIVLVYNNLQIKYNKILGNINIIHKKAFFIVGCLLIDYISLNTPSIEG